MKMSILGSQQNMGTDPEDIVCAGCGAPLLSLKTVCVRCGGHAKSLKVIQTEANTPARKSTASAPSFSEKMGNAFLEQLIFLTAGLGVLFAMVNPFISGFTGADLFRSFMALAVSVGLLGLKALLTKS